MVHLPHTVILTLCLIDLKHVHKVIAMVVFHPKLDIFRKYQLILYEKNKLRFGIFLVP